MPQRMVTKIWMLIPSLLIRRCMSLAYYEQRGLTIYRALLSKRLIELKNALSVRSDAAHTLHLAHLPSSGTRIACNRPSKPLLTPGSDDHPSRALGYQTPTSHSAQPRFRRMSSDDFDLHHTGNHETILSTVESIQTGATTPPRIVSSKQKAGHLSPRPLHGIDLNAANDYVEQVDEEIIPPSSAPDENTPHRSPRRNGISASKSRRVPPASLKDVPIDAFFASSQKATPLRLPRAEPFSARTALGGPGPSISISTRVIQAQKATKVDMQHPWSKEVNQKLRQVFKLPRFRTHQKEAIDETMAGKDGQYFMPMCEI